ncbi:MAG: DUF262 domain-containing protein [Mariprofundaceae bacterium]|nr:DUF262 domain-containing protein [Mariprofundaceae bacterium]
MSSTIDIEAIENQIEIEIKTYDYDTLEYPIEVIVSKYENSLDDECDEDSLENVIYIPDYQREFVWSQDRRSKFIESIILGVPIPYFFFADVNGKMEIVDGSQRIRTMAEYIRGDLKLSGLKKLTALNKSVFSDLPKHRRRRILNKGLRAIYLSEKTNGIARFDLFERLNTGSDELKPAEIRKGAMAGPFYDFLNECSEDPIFKKICPITNSIGMRSEGTERILRFFAYSHSLKKYKGTVSPFLDAYMKNMNEKFDCTMKLEMRAKFNRMTHFVSVYFPSGFRKTMTAKSTPRVRFEAISIGVSNALDNNESLKIHSIDWLDSQEFKTVTRSDAANNKKNLERRINFVRDKLLGSN